METLKFNVFGRDVLIVKKDDGWDAYYFGSEGKRRPATDITVPSNITESELTQYLDDLCHEWASDQNSSVIKLD